MEKDVAAAAASSSNKRQRSDDVLENGEPRQPPPPRYLLLHCVDGCVPYLNPSQLERYFPPSSTNLWLGLAVQDTCVRPVLEKPVDKKKKKKKKQQRGDQKDEDASESKEPPQKETNRVRGYAFHPVTPDSWLLPYKRVTVPCFYEQTVAPQNGDSKPKKKNKQKKQNSDKAMFVWTPHGRQQLTAEAYAVAALEGLQSNFTMSLFDDDPSEPKRKNVAKKAKRENVDGETTQPRQPAPSKSVQRNEQWYRHLVEAVEKTGANNKLWKPVLIPAPEQEQNDSNTEESQPKNDALCDGVALIGQWRPGLSCIYNFNPDIQQKAILSTSSLSEILGILAEGRINVIGTSLPTQWAKNKMALGIDLANYQRNGNNSKKQKVAAESSEEQEKDNNLTLNFNGCMDMSDTSYARDPRPLVEGCICMACTNSRFSRAYVHHLVCAKEMLAEILIFGHNLHHLLKLLDLFNTTEGDSSDDLKEYIESQLPVFEVST